MAATLAQLGVEKARRRVVVLGAMKELGAQSQQLHAGLAGPLESAGVEIALLVGEEMAPLAEVLAGRLELQHVDDAVQAAERVAGLLRDGDVVLVKGSNSVGLSRLVTALSAEAV